MLVRLYFLICFGYRIYSYIFIVPLKSIPRASQRREYMQTNINISFGRKYLLVKRVDRFYGLSIRITGDCSERAIAVVLTTIYERSVRHNNS